MTIIVTTITIMIVKKNDDKNNIKIKIIIN
jgi:hypothetical protein